MNVATIPCLILNGSYEPIHVASAKRALQMVVKGKAVVEEERDHYIHRRYRCPSVVRLKDFRHLPRKMMLLTRKNIYLRDGYVCQYCGVKFHASQLTLDHVIPQSRGGQNRWENMVTACGKCNHKKGDKTPEEAGMPLLRKPKALTIHTARGVMRQHGYDEPTWRRYLYF